MSTPESTGTGRPLRTAGLALLAVAGISLLIAFVTWLDSGGNGRPTAGGTTTETPGSAPASPSAPPAGETTAPAPGGAAPVTPGDPGQPAPGQPGAGQPGAGHPTGPGQPGGQAQPGPGQPGGADQPGAAGAGDAGAPGQPGGAEQPPGPSRPGGASAAPPPGTGAQPGGEARPAPGSGTVGGGGGGGGGDPTRVHKNGVERAELRVYNNSYISGLAARAAEDFRSEGWRVVEVGNYSGGTIPTSTVYYQRGTGQRGAAEALGDRFGLRVEPRFAGIRDSAPGVVVIVTKDYRG